MSAELEEVRAALDECDLRPHGSLADRIRALTHHHREWKSLYADAANRLAETQRALSDGAKRRDCEWLTPDRDRLVELLRVTQSAPRTRALLAPLFQQIDDLRRAFAETPK